MGNKNVEFSKGKFSSRIFAYIFDFVCTVITTILLVLLTQVITMSVPSYKAILHNMEQLEISSHLYIENDKGEYVRLSRFYVDPKDDEELKAFNNKLDEGLIMFYSDPLFFDQSDPESGLYLYNIQKIPEGNEYSDLFVKDVFGNPKESATASLEDLYNFYCRALEQDAVAYLMTNNEYMNSSRTITLVFFFIELLIPIVISATLFSYIIPLFDKHGRRSLGKRIFKLGVVDSKGLSPTIGRFTCRFLVYLLLEIIISIPILLIPMIISFSMLTFSSLGQSLHDYFCSTYVVDISQNYICKDEDEYDKRHAVGEEVSMFNKEAHIE